MGMCNMMVYLAFMGTRLLMRYVSKRRQKKDSSVVHVPQAPFCWMTGYVCAPQSMRPDGLLHSPASVDIRSSQAATANPTSAGVELCGKQHMQFGCHPGRPR